MTACKFKAAKAAGAGRDALWRGLCRDRQGAVSIELALVAIFLAVICMGTYDFARYSMESLRVSQAARAGLQYALQDPDSADNVDAIKQAVRNDAQDSANLLNITVPDVVDMTRPRFLYLWTGRR